MTLNVAAANESGRSVSSVVIAPVDQWHGDS